MLIIKKIKQKQPFHSECTVTVCTDISKWVGGLTKAHIETL